jgi:hypothetical protein
MAARNERVGECPRDIGQTTGLVERKRFRRGE